MTVIRVATWNLFEFDRHRGDKDAATRYRRISSVLAELDVDIAAAEEVCGRGSRALEELAVSAGLDCWYDPPFVTYERRVAITDTGSRESDFHVGLLWTRKAAKVRAHRDGFRGYPGGGEFWHGLALQKFEIEGLDRPLVVGSYHGAPFAQDARPDEARRVVSAMTRPDPDHRLAIVGADWNSISADRIQNPDGTWTYWHPDPYWNENGQNTWRDIYNYQCIVTERDEQGRPTRWHADRRPGQVLLDAGCRDAAALAGAAWTPTTGHHPADDAPFRTIDTHRVSPALAPAVIGWEVIDTDAARKVSDHLPVVTTLDLARLPAAA
ncbi:hypothetical protein BAY61_32105 (plasmid) [Prauserella marina]|uniref:Uncharacterized protein n=1 Tax=Prauserella marina TaxID=530584 RepID=A0A222W143_9PSEU|nr:hypothetical protein [Prauserella marina]ASR39928.1 hypothetical protein BAY61_32105 [Prauserella marina]PWV71429.1 hypothetical protein DES30_112145 [Prauserella marina]SDD97835.1 hypothetical protein SAMN05421630_115134 [Prauserella marina]